MADYDSCVILLAQALLAPAPGPRIDSCVIILAQAPALTRASFSCLMSEPPTAKRSRTMTTEECCDTDPGLFILLASDQTIHLALGLPSSPIPQEQTAAQSATLFKKWLITLISDFGGGGDVSS